jgi:hypothetical protein
MGKHAQEVTSKCRIQPQYGSILYLSKDKHTFGNYKANEPGAALYKKLPRALQTTLVGGQSPQWALRSAYRKHPRKSANAGGTLQDLGTNKAEKII